MYALYIRPLDDALKEYYEKVAAEYNTKVDGLMTGGKYSVSSHYQMDSGFDLVVPKRITRLHIDGDSCFSLDHMVQCALYKVDMDGDIVHPSAYYLYPRSSISKTQFRMSNSVGIIDSGYRGNIIGKMDIINGISGQSYVIDKGSRMFQICTPTLEPIYHIKVVDHLDDTERGAGGFGSSDSVVSIKSAGDFSRYLNSSFKLDKTVR
jgi:dUTP pyrophosphatase